MGRDLLRLGSMTRCGTRLRLAPRRPERILGDIGNQDRNTHCRLMQAQKAEGARTISAPDLHCRSSEVGPSLSARSRRYGRFLIYECGFLERP